jgi:hypothetical protein
VDYRDVLATVVGASVAGLVAFVIRLAFNLDAAVLALIYAATYSLLWSIVGEHARLLFHRRLPEHTRFDGHWRAITGSIALVAALCAGLIVAFAVSHHSFSGASTGLSGPSVPVTRTLAVQERVVVTRKTIVLPVRTMVVTAPVTLASTVPTPQRREPATATVFQRTVVVVRPPVTVTVSSTESRTTTVTRQATVADPRTVTTVTTAPGTTVTTTATTTSPATTATGTETTTAQPETTSLVVTDPTQPPPGQ